MGTRNARLSPLEQAGPEGKPLLVVLRRTRLRNRPLPALNGIPTGSLSWLTCTEAGMTQVAYCREQGLHLAQFGYWKKRLLPDELLARDIILADETPGPTGNSEQLA